MSDEFLSVELDQKAVARVHKQLAKLDKPGIADRLNKGTLAALRILAPSVKAAAPHRTGTLAGSVKVRKARTGEMGALLGPGTSYRHLVIRPHRIVTPGGRDTGRKTTGNPFIDRAVEPRLDAAMAEVQKALFADD